MKSLRNVSKKHFLSVETFFFLKSKSPNLSLEHLKSSDFLAPCALKRLFLAALPQKSISPLSYETKSASCNIDNISNWASPTLQYIICELMIFEKVQ